MTGTPDGFCYINHCACQAANAGAGPFSCVEVRLVKTCRWEVTEVTLSGELPQGGNKKLNH